MLIASLFFVAYLQVTVTSSYDVSSNVSDKGHLDLVGELNTTHCSSQMTSSMNDSILVLCSAIPSKSFLRTIRIFENKYPFEFQNSIIIDEIHSPRLMVTSETVNCLYVVDDDYPRNYTKIIWKINLDDYTVTKWLSFTEVKYALSASPDGRVFLFTETHKNGTPAWQLRTYGTDGRHVQSISLSDSFNHKIITSVQILEQRIVVCLRSYSRDWWIRMWPLEELNDGLKGGQLIWQSPPPTFEWRSRSKKAFNLKAVERSNVQSFYLDKFENLLIYASRVTTFVGDPFDYNTAINMTTQLMMLRQCSDSPGWCSKYRLDENRWIYRNFNLKADLHDGKSMPCIVESLYYRVLIYQLR